MGARPPLVGVRPRSNVHLIALGIGERPPLWRVGVVDDAATSSHGRVDAGPRLVLGEVEIDESPSPGKDRSR
jgi:hypothetical protein